MAEATRVEAGRRPSGQPAVGPATTEEPLTQGSQMSLAESRRKRRARIARRAAAASAAASAAALTRDQPDPAPEAQEVEGLAATAATGVGAAGKKAASRVWLSARGFASGYREGRHGAPRPVGRKRLDPFSRAKTRVSRVLSMKDAGAASGAPVSPVPRNPLAVLASGDPVTPKRRRRPRLSKPIAWAGGLLAAPAVMAAVLVLLAVVAGALGGGVLGGSSRNSSVQGLPEWFNSDMVMAALEAERDFGHPAGCTIAQALVESGSGSTPSQLAAEDHNLFGMKWHAGYADAAEVDGYSSYPTQEESAGAMHWVDAEFIRFKSGSACIKFRSNRFLQGERYAGNALIRRAIEEKSSDLMAEGLKDAGWATSSSYVESLKSMMDRFSLRTFDQMTPETFAQIQAAGKGAEYAASDAAARNIADCTGKVGSPGPGLCAMWVSRVYQLAGCGYPGGNACDMYYAFCSSSDRSKLKVGMAVAVPSYGGDPTGMGQIYGHVAIYIGDGMVRDNIGYVNTQSLDSWIAYYGNTHEVRWGYPPGVQGK